MFEHDGFTTAVVVFEIAGFEHVGFTTVVVGVESAHFEHDGLTVVVAVFEMRRTVEGKIATECSLSVEACSSRIFSKRCERTTHCGHCAREAIVTCITPQNRLVKRRKVVHTLALT